MLSKIIANLNSKKSAGHDIISYIMLKKLPNGIKSLCFFLKIELAVSNFSKKDVRDVKLFLGHGEVRGVV